MSKTFNKVKDYLQSSIRYLTFRLKSGIFR